MSIKESIPEENFAAFLGGYVTALLWSSSGEIDGKMVNLDQYETSTQADDHCRAACRAFMEANRVDLVDAVLCYSTSVSEGYSMAGHDFALTRNRHGADFWDGDLPQELGARLTDSAHKAGECWPYLGDDEQVYIQ